MDPGLDRSAGWTGIVDDRSRRAFGNGGCAERATRSSVTAANLGSLCLTGNYVNGNRSFTGSTMVLSGSAARW